MTTLDGHEIVSQEAWVASRKALLAREKAFTQEREALAEARRALPWVRVEKDYRFQGSDGERRLPDLFDGRSQLIVQHFMFGADWDDGCPSCSFWSDGYERIIIHLNGPRRFFRRRLDGSDRKAAGHAATPGLVFCLGFEQRRRFQS